MAEKQKNRQKSRESKQSAGQHGAGGKAFHTKTVMEKVKVKNPKTSAIEVKEVAREVNVRGLSEVQKALMNSGMTHHLRKGKRRLAAEDTKAGRARIAAAKAQIEKEKVEARKKKQSSKGSRKIAAASAQA